MRFLYSLTLCYKCSVFSSLPRPLIKSWSCFKKNKVSTAKRSFRPFWRRKGGQKEFHQVYHLAKICWSNVSIDTSKLYHKVITQQAQLGTRKIQIWNNQKKYINKLLEVVETSRHVFDSLIVTIILFWQTRASMIRGSWKLSNLILSLLCSCAHSGVEERWDSWRRWGINYLQGTRKEVQISKSILTPPLNLTSSPAQKEHSCTKDSKWGVDFPCSYNFVMPNTCIPLHTPRIMSHLSYDLLLRCKFFLVLFWYTIIKSMNELICVKLNNLLAVVAGLKWQLFGKEEGFSCEWWLCKL